MTQLIPIALFGWIPVVLILFVALPTRQAIAVSFIFGWLFLPIGGYDLPGLPAYTKITATSVAVLMGVLIFDSGRLFTWRLHILDLPAVIWCFCPMVTSVTNGLGVYDGVSNVYLHVMTWGVPYYLGRIYFNNPASLRQLAIWVFIGGLAYVPFCLYEIKMSPQLHKMIYGYHQHTFRMTKRLGGWRPMVFLQNGIILGTWMSTTAVIGIWLWMTGSLKKLWGIPLPVLASIQAITMIMCKSINAMGLFTLGVATLFMTKKLRTPIVLLCLASIPPVYMGVRMSGNWSGDGLVNLAEIIINKERAQSLSFRLENENILADKALNRPLFGWGGWSRNRVFSARTGKDISITDGLWIITLGKFGLVGLASMTLMILLPVIVIWRRFPAYRWSEPPTLACITGLGVVLVLYMIDNLPNASENQIFMLAAGGIIGLIQTVPSLKHQLHRRQVMRQQRYRLARG